MLTKLVYFFFAFFAPYLERPCARHSTSAVSSAPRTTCYRTAGKSFARPPRSNTTLCSCRLCPIPGIYACTSMLLDKRTLAYLRSAEFGFFGVNVPTRVQTPRFCGEFSVVYCFLKLLYLLLSAGESYFFGFLTRPLRTS